MEEIIHILLIMHVCCVLKQCRFTKCTFCTLVKREMLKSTSKEEREKLRDLLQDHLKLQELVRFEQLQYKVNYNYSAKKN